MPGDTLYVKNLQIEPNTSTISNGFSSIGFGNLAYDGTEILGSGGVGNWTKDGTNIYYDGGNVGIQNTNPQHALVVGEPGIVTTNVEINGNVNISNSLNVTGQESIIKRWLRIPNDGSQSAISFRPTKSYGTDVGKYYEFSLNGDADYETLTLYTELQGTGVGVIVASFSRDICVIPPALVEGDLTLRQSGVFHGNGSGISDLNASNLTTGTLSIGRIANETITNAKLATGISADKITTGTLNSDRLGNGTITNAKLATGISANKITTGTLPNGRLGSDYTGVGSITLGSSKNIEVLSGQLSVGVFNGFGKVCIENDTIHNAPFPGKTIYPHLYLEEKTDESVRFHIGVHENDTVDQLFVGINASHTANCLYFIPNHSISSGSALFNSGGFISNHGTSTQLNFTGQHRCKSENIDLYSNTYVGYIVGSNGSYSMIGSTVKTTSNNIHINECLPYVSLSNTENQSNVFGVISNIEDKNVESREMTHGVWASVVPKTKGDSRVIVNSLGEGAIWVSNVNGPLINGDYITTSSIPGLGMKQNENQLMNYTVAKITMDCDFDPIEEPIMVARVEDIHSNVEQYHNNTYTITQVNIVYDQDTGHWVQKEETITKTKREQVFEEVDLYNEQDEIIDKHRVPVYETITRQENVLDENGQLVFDDSGQTQPAYLVKYVSSDGTILDSEQPGCYKMAFVGCTYHCG